MRLGGRGTQAHFRHCEERSDAAIQCVQAAPGPWIAAPFGLAMTVYSKELVTRV